MGSMVGTGRVRALAAIVVFSLLRRARRAIILGEANWKEKTEFQIPMV